MHASFQVSLTLPMHISGDSINFGIFGATFKHAENTSPLPLVDNFYLGNLGYPYSDHAIVYSPAHLGRYLEDTLDDQLWAFTVMLESVNEKSLRERARPIRFDEFETQYAKLFVRDPLKTARLMHVTASQVYSNWEAQNQRQTLNASMSANCAQKTVRKI